MLDKETNNKNCLVNKHNYVNKNKPDSFKYINNPIPSYHYELKNDLLSKSNKNIAVFGGSFDPPTLSHIILACEIYNQINEIDEVWLTPCGDGRPDKKLKANGENRINMLELIIKDVVYSDLPVYVNSAEIENGTFMPTYDLLTKLSNDFPEYKFYFTFGSDLAESLPNWEYGNEIINKYNPILISRPGYKIFDKESTINYIDKCIVIQSYLDVSSTLVRNRIEEKQYKKDKIHLGISGLTSRSVLNYIYKNSLYKIETTSFSDNYDKCILEEKTYNTNKKNINIKNNIKF